MNAAVVTGGSRGLGSALCDAYAARGWSVMELSRTAPHPYSVQLDLGDLSAAAAAFKEVFTSLAAAECEEVVVVNNAAVLGPVGPIDTMAPEAIARTCDINVTAGVLLAREFARAFGGRSCAKSFVNISSGAAIHAHAGWALYSASKAAMEHFVRVMAVEQATQRYPVTAFSVNPGVMDTAMQGEVRSATPDAFPEVERYIHLQRAGLLVPPDRVAEGIVEMVTSRPDAGGTYAVPV